MTLLVTDACESCAPNQLNLHALAFQNNFNSDLSVGRVNITFEQVSFLPATTFRKECLQTGCREVVRWQERREGGRVSDRVVTEVLSICHTQFVNMT